MDLPCSEIYKFGTLFNEISQGNQPRLLSKWLEVADVLGDATKWPHNIRKLFWSSNLRHFDRILVCTLVHVNGLNPLLFEEWWRLIGFARDRSAERHLQSLLELFDEGRYADSLYAYNIAQNQYHYLSRRVRQYQPRHLRQ